MAPKIDQEFLKKHHFWVLHAVLLIGLALAWFGLLVSVPDSIAEQGDKNKKEKQTLDNTKAQPRKTLEEYDKRKQELFVLRSKRWQDMWEIQKNMYEWPTVLGEEQLAKTSNLKFGDDISNAQLLEAFKTQYAKEYEALAKTVAPLQFLGGWQGVLRHVAQWRLTPESEEVWLALEDMWIQREIIQTISRINVDAAKFAPVNPGEDPTKVRTRSFRNRTWKIDLEIAEIPGGQYALRGKLKNLTERLQAFGANNELILKVWLSDDPNAKPFELAIEGTSLDGGKEEAIKYVEKKHKIFEGRVVGLYRVEQVFDARTLPIKRFDKLALGYTSARHSLAELEMTPFSAKVVEAEGAAAPAGPGGPGGPGAPGGPGGPPPMGPGGPPPKGPGGFGGQGENSAANSKDFSPNLLVRRRYVHRTDQVRSMPIGLMLVCDQTYSADVLTALANSRLRLQIVQSHLSRFRGTISYFGEGVPAGRDPEAPGGPPPMGPGGPPPMGSSGGPPPMGPGGPGFPGFTGAGGAGAPRSSSEDMIAANLIELSVYGIASLYEQYQSPTAKKDDTPVAPVAPAPMPVTPTVPMPVTPAAPVPMPPMAPMPAAPAPVAPVPAVPSPKM